MDDLVRRVLTARVGEVLSGPTPLDPAPGLSRALGTEVLLKREDLTPVFSFKLRGAYNRIVALDPEERARGVIAASAGNHAQGVAFSAARLRIPCLIVMPRTTPAIKVQSVEGLGARVELVGDSYSDAALRADDLAQSTDMIPIPPYDDPLVIAGQGTVAAELVHQAPRETGIVFVPVGGGGLAAGMAGFLKAVRPEIRVVGVEPMDADAMARSLEAGERVVLPEVGIFADGVAVRQVGVLTFDLCRRFLDGVIRVSTDDICAAIKDTFQETRSVLEPAGALGVAGLRRWARTRGLPPGAAVAVTSGANMNFTRLRYVAERADVGEGREILLAVRIPERPGAFLRFATLVGDRGVTEFNYRLSSREGAVVFAGLEAGGSPDVPTLLAALEAEGYGVEELSGDDVAQEHVRYMVGGRTPEVRDEVIVTFQFPERPGALLQFLRSLGTSWNISLFHYRNHGAAYGRVLCGMEVPVEERADLWERLHRLGFPWDDVTESPSVRRFLRHA
jgi:threonine dehydratase